MRSIQTHLTWTLLLCILLPTALIGGFAYWSVYKDIRDSRIETVDQVASARYRELQKRLTNDNERSQGLLSALVVACRDSDNGVYACARPQLQQFFTVNQAVGLAFYASNGVALTVGDDAVALEHLHYPFLPEQIAETSKSRLNGKSLYSLVSVDSSSGFKLVTTYPEQRLQEIFVSSPVLGKSGENFLANHRGMFVTKPRYPSEQGNKVPISAMPMRRCLQKENSRTLDLDYRNIPIIHGFRYVPEIGGGCIMAHIDQAEAFEPLHRLVLKLSLAALVFVVFAWLLAIVIGRKMSRPILVLADMAQSLAEGDFSRRVNTNHYREIFDLAQLFNGMAEQLDITVSRLRASEKALEQTVAARTLQLQERHRKYRSVIQNTSEGFWQVDFSGRLIEVNPAYARLSGYSPDELIGMKIYELDAEESPEQAERHILTIMQFGNDNFETRHRRKDGSEWDVEVNATFINEDGGYFVAFLKDITDRKRTDQELRIAATAFETQEGILITDADQIIMRVNSAFTQITGYTAEEVIGKKPSILKSGRHDQAFYRNMYLSLQQEGQWEGEIWDRHKDGHIYPKWLAIAAVKDDAGRITHYVGNSTDITERKASEDKIKMLAFYDTLTELANRRLLTERLEHAVAIQARTGDCCALLFLDLDNFKLLNDSQGHGVGDELLVEVARRLKHCVRETDTVARLGGDEFIVLLEELSSAYESSVLQVKSVTEKIISELSKPYALSTIVHNCSSSIGVVLFNGPNTTADEVLAQADTAMYAAKKSGKNAYRFFDPSMQLELEQRMKFESELRRAIEEKQLELYYQPQVNDKQELVGVEALIRWHHPELGLIMPDQFIPLAEETDLILIIGGWVLETACIQLRLWNEQFQSGNIGVAVNISAKQFYQPTFVDDVRNVIVQNRIGTQQLKLELTESIVMKKTDLAIEKMLALKAMGVVLAMDDFGTGYSSLSYLKNLPFDQIKIDKSFVDDIRENKNDAYIIHSVITLGRLMDIVVVAEGVEYSEQDELLKSLGCTVFQGYLFGKPVPAGELESRLLTAPED